MGRRGESQTSQMKAGLAAQTVVAFRRLVQGVTQSEQKARSSGIVVMPGPINNRLQVHNLPHKSSHAAKKLGIVIQLG
jgi:hypothetical protein